MSLSTLTPLSRQEEIVNGLLRQAEHCTKNGAPITGKICKSFIEVMKGDSAVGRAIAQVS